MLYYIGNCLIVWILVGLIMGLKCIFIDKKFTPENIEAKRIELSVDDDDIGYNLFTKNKYTFLAITSLAGFIPLVADIYGTFKYKEGK